MTNKSWAANVQAKARLANIENVTELHRLVQKAGLKVVFQTVWRWWNGIRKPSTAEQYAALDIALGIKNSERLFDYNR